MAKELTDEQKIQLLTVALNSINKIVYANNIRLGSTEYFKIRNTCVNAIKAVGGVVQ